MVRLIAIFLLVASLWLAWALVIPVAPPAPQVLLFPPGSSSKAIAAELERSGVLRSRFAFDLLHYALPKKKLKAGEYRFASTASGLEVFQRIARGDVLIRTVVVPEGYNVFEIAAAIGPRAWERRKTSSPWPRTIRRWSAPSIRRRSRWRGICFPIPINFPAP